MSTLEGKLVANNMKVGIVVARFNEFITNKLLGGAMDGLLRHDVKEEDITVAWVPCMSVIFTKQESQSRPGIAKRWGSLARTRQIRFLWEIRSLRMCVGQI